MEMSGGSVGRVGMDTMEMTGGCMEGPGGYATWIVVGEVERRWK